MPAERDISVRICRTMTTADVRVGAAALLGLVPRTGLNPFINHWQNSLAVPHKEILHFPKATAIFQKDRLRFGE